MTTAIEKLEKDVTIIAAMAAEMEAYLDSDVLFWHMRTLNSPSLTLGGYLMRQHRLLALRTLLNAEYETTLDSAVEQFNSALVERIIRYEQKAHRELEARLRQWGEFLNDVDRGVAGKTSNYATAVETRVMLTDISESLRLPPYKLDPHVTSQIGLLDSRLRQVFQPSEFIWFEEWQPAYPELDYWYLYGNFRGKLN